MKNLPFKLVVGALALVVAFAIFGTDRPFVLNSRPVVTHVGEINVPAEMGDMIAGLDDFGLHVHRQPSKIERILKGHAWLLGYSIKPDSYDNMTPPAMGYSIREVGFLGMPFGWYTELGNVVYVRNDWGAIYGPLTPEALEKINRANQRDVTKGAFFPFWAHSWGWLWVIGFLLALYLWHDANVRRRAETGMID